MDKMTRPAALITGGATRLGLAFAKALANAGYDIALHYHRSIAAAASAAEDIETLGVKCITFQADLAAPAPETLINRVVDELPNLSVLINSASAYEAATIANTSMELLQQQFTVPIWVVFNRVLRASLLIFWIIKLPFSKIVMLHTYYRKKP